MYGDWDLSPLYDGFETEKFKNDLSRLTELCGYICKLGGEAESMPDGEFIEKYLRTEEEKSSLVSKIVGYTELRRAKNSHDAEASSVIGRVMALISTTAGAEAGIRRYIGEIPELEKLISKSPLLTEHSYLLRCMKDDAKYLLGGKEEEILSKMDICGGLAWSDLQTQLTSSVAVDYDGGTVSLSDIRNLAYDADAEVRKKAYYAELACYEKIKDSVAFAMNSIKLQAITEAELRGFGGPLDSVLHSSRIRKETLDALIAAMEEYMPHFRRYLKTKAKLLGYEGGLPWYDLFAPIGKEEKKYTPEESRAYLNRVFGSFDSELAEMAENAFENDRIDFFPKEGKTGGAFCYGIRSIGGSFILTNFGGNFTDVMTLAHELGHAFHDKLVYDVHGQLNIDYSMPVAETASNFNEVITMDYALGYAESKAEKLALLEGKLSDTTQIICDCYSRFLFEKAVIENRENEFLPAERLCEIMLDAQDKTYGDGLDKEIRHPYMWLCKSHYYSAGLSFYNWPYSFGGLFAQGLYAKYKKEGKSFVPLYKKLLRGTTVNSVEGAAQIAGIDVTDPSFWREGLDCFVSMIDEFEALTKE